MYIAIKPSSLKSNGSGDTCKKRAQYYLVFIQFFLWNKLIGDINIEIITLYKYGYPISSTSIGGKKWGLKSGQYLFKMPKLIATY